MFNNNTKEILDGLREPTWKVPMPNQTPEWEKHFSKYWGAMFESGDFDALMIDIRDLLSSQRQELLEKVKLEKKDYPSTVDFSLQQWTLGYNEAIDDLEKLKESL